MEQLAARYGLTPSIGEAFKGVIIDHIDQTNESDLVFLTRLATEQDAIATVKSSRLMVIKASNGTTTSGQPLPAITITRQDGDQHCFSVEDRDAYTGVIAYWQDNKAAEKKKIEVKCKRKTKPKEERPLPPGVVVNKKENELLVGDSENVKERRHVYASQKCHTGPPGLSGKSCSAAWPSSRSSWPKAAPSSTRNNPPRSGASNHKSTRPTGYSPRLCTTLTDQGYTNRLQLEVKLEELRNKSVWIKFEH